MVRRNSWRKLVLAAVCLMPAGCQTLHSWLHKDDDDKMASSDSKDDSNSKIIGSSPDDKTSANSFFKSDRRVGGLSSEAQSIERDLGAY
jgi:hypothetical protein